MKNTYFTIGGALVLLGLAAGLFFVKREHIVVPTISIIDVKEEIEDWGLGFGKEGERPSGNVPAEKMKEYDAYYIGKDANEIYLTFDCGYENGNTDAILDALKKHNAKATFFVVGHYLKTAPAQVKRMVNEGHTVGNHTFHHPNMADISDKESFKKELTEVETLYKEMTGLEMTKFYRPPQGKFSTNNLKMAKALGYKTFFWSLAYVDWKTDKQVAPKDAIRILNSRIHPGAIVLLHVTSSTNAEILDQLLADWEEKGYTFGILDNID